MNHPPNPALVSERDALRLPRSALLLFCAAYLLPGVFGRDPWKSADITAFGYMMSLARGEALWHVPTLGGVPGDGGVLPYWLGAVSVRLLSPWAEPALAARLPFALLLLATLALLWYATFHLARSKDAQPLPFAFGGEAQPLDYARAIADGAVLALISSLGLLQLGHETTPELAQLAGTALLLYGLAAAPYSSWQSRLALVAAPIILAASAAPTTSVALGVVGTIVNARSRHQPARRSNVWLAVGVVGAVLVATALGSWGWRQGTATNALGLPKLMAWFTWPAWLLAAWTLWRWRRHLGSRHVAAPLACAAVAVASSAVMGASDRALMLALPGMAVLAAFALPTFKRSMGAAIDWFSVFFFTGWALAFWVVYASMHLGIPAQPAANVARLLPGFTPSFNALALVCAIAGTVAWIGLVAWRTGRHQHPMWKSLVLPAGGVALNWLLAMSLMLPAIDHAFSYKRLVERVAQHVPRDTCIDATGLGKAQVAALELHSPHRHWRVQAVGNRAATCEWKVVSTPMRQAAPLISGWSFVAREQRPGDRNEAFAVYRRAAR